MILSDMGGCSSFLVLTYPLCTVNCDMGGVHQTLTFYILSHAVSTVRERHTYQVVSLFFSALFAGLPNTLYIFRKKTGNRNFWDKNCIAMDFLI